MHLPIIMKLSGKQSRTFSSGLLFLHSVLITGTLARLELSTQQQPTLSSVAPGTAMLARFRIRGAASEPAAIVLLLLHRLPHASPTYFSKLSYC